MDVFVGSQSLCCGDLGCCEGQVVTIVVDGRGVQMPMCIGHLGDYLVSIRQKITVSP